MADSQIRIERSGGFTVLQNEALRDPRLSFKARGLMAYMLSLPPEWNFSVSGLSALNKDGKDSIRSALKELEEAGYLTRDKQSHDGGGKFGGCVYILHDTASPLAGNPTTVKPTTGKPSTENPTQINTYQVSKDSSNTPPLPPQGGAGRKEKKAELEPEVKAMLREYVGGDRELTEAMAAYIDVRLSPKSKAVNTPRAIRAALSQLDKLSGGNRETKVQILLQSAGAGWAGVFALRGNGPPGKSRDRPRRVREEVPNW